MISIVGDDLHKLCHGAHGIGPADCFIESRNLGSNLERTTLCNGAKNNVRTMNRCIVL